MTLPFRKSALILATSLAIAACGGGGGSSKKNDGPGKGGGDATVQTGIFVDSPVAGISYKTKTQSGVTNAFGEYDYLPDEEVTFFIGDLKFPPVKASGIVTPADIANGNTTLQTNILQILQTLDADGDPSNGITIRKDAAEHFIGAELKLAEESFDTEVASILQKIDENLRLVDEDKANEHFGQTLRSMLLGSWVYSEGAGKRNVLTFMDDDDYIIIHEHGDESADNDSQKAGSVEFGTYSWDTKTSEFEVSEVLESDGSGGLWHDGSTVKAAKLTGNTLTLTIVDSDGEYEVPFTRVTNESNPLIGGWYLWEDLDDGAGGDPNGRDNENILTFLSGSEYAIAHTNNQENYGNAPNQPLSGEFGTYKLDGNNFYPLSAHVDTDGEGGLFNKENLSDNEGERLIITPWGDLNFIDANEGTYTFIRIGSFPVELHAKGKLGTIRVVRDIGDFDEDDLLGAEFNIAVKFADGSAETYRFVFSDTTVYDSETETSKGSVTVSAVNQKTSFTGEWTRNSAGTALITGEGGIEVAIAAIEDDRVLLSWKSPDLEALWESKIEGWSY